MQKVLSFAVAAAMLAGTTMAAGAMPSVAATLGTGADDPALIRVAAGCGPGRYRGVGGHCQGHMVPTIRKVCTARRYAGALVRRCHVVTH